MLMEVKRSPLRVIICGSVDDGKSTLLGRLLYETGNVPDDIQAALVEDSRQFGTTGGALDYALLVDGLEAEREQGITIDVAYRFMNAKNRRIVIADCPGHEQYTRNMATGSSVSDLAILLVDARKGVLPQTLRHTYIAHLFGIREILLAVNKMDQVDWSKSRFDEISAGYRAKCAALEDLAITAIPVSAAGGDNLVRQSAASPWYEGPVLLDCVNRFELKSDGKPKPFRMTVQRVLRPDMDTRLVTGTIAQGTVRAGDELVALPSGRHLSVRDIAVAGRESDRASDGDAVSLAFVEHADLGRGEVLVAPKDRAVVTDQFSAHILWLSDERMLPGRTYRFAFGPQATEGYISSLRHGIDIGTWQATATRSLDLNAIGVGHVALARPVALEPYRDCRGLGSFVIIDTQSAATVGVGIVDFELRRSQNIHLQAVDIDKASRAASLRQRPRCLWFTGLSASGKSTIANGLERVLHAHGRHTYLLDGDNVRHGLNRDLGFTAADRVENVRRVAEVARLMVDAGLIVLVAFISPFRTERQMARDMFEADEFLEIFVDCPLEICERRDPKGLYRKARAGGLVNFTGIDQPYEPPSQPDVHLRTDGNSTLDEEIAVILTALGERRN